MLFLVTVDAEEEWDWPTGLPSPPFRTGNIERIPQFQSVCTEAGLKPTYFVDAAVLEEKKNIRILSDYLNRDECDVGAQLHPWCTDPVTEPLDDFHSHTINLELGLAATKLVNLTRMLGEAFGQHPFSFRCGRWGMNGQLLRLLAEQGYRVDSSVRPRYRTDYFDYLDANCGRPYWPSFTDVSKIGNQRQILEIPASDGFSNGDFEQQERLHERLGKPPFAWFRSRGVLWQLGALRKISMTPEGMQAKDLCNCIDRHVERGNEVITLFLHSSDLLPGATPYVKDERDLARFLQTIRDVAVHARDTHGATFVTMREAHSLLTREPDDRLHPMGTSAP